MFAVKAKDSDLHAPVFPRVHSGVTPKNGQDSTVSRTGSGTLRRQPPAAGFLLRTEAVGTSDSFLCPAGQRLHPYSSSLMRGLKKINYRNSQACRDCPIRSQCTGKSIPLRVPSRE
jgi:hypothetical protein